MPHDPKYAVRYSQAVLAIMMGLLAILLWSSLAVVTTFAASIPRFELLWLSFGVAFIVGSSILSITGRLREMVQPISPWIIGFCGIFFFHLFYFVGIALAPPAKVTLVSYLWPTMLVVCTAFLGKKQFHPAYLLGAAMGLIGTACLMSGDWGASMNLGVLFGYFLAFLCAVTWTGYSIINRKYVSVPSGMLIGVCGAISLVAMGIHFVFEPTVIPSTSEALVLFYLGCGPTGVSFLAWDYACKHGNLSLIGTLSYLAPLLSMFWLIMAGKAIPTTGLLIAIILIVGGAVVATYPLRQGKA